MTEETRVSRNFFTPTRFFLALTVLLACAVAWFLFQRWEVSQAEKHLGFLEPSVFQTLPLGSVKPTGWLLEQMKLQASGLSGHLDEFWPDVENSGWIGGQAEGWERAPYWLDGVIPLAYLTDDPALKAKVKRWVDYILEHPLRDGWLGPERGNAATGSNAPPLNIRDPWPQFVILKALAQYQEASGDPRIIPAIQNSLRSLDYQLDRRPLFAWNFFRWPDALVTIFWLHERTGETWLLNLARKIVSQGYNWPKHFSNLPIKDKSREWNWEGHVVNNAMGLKASALLYRLTGEGRYKKGAGKALAELELWHGEANGLFSGDECLAGRNPSQGTELCAIVENMYSLETDLSVLGGAEFADRLEKIAYNALPAAFTPDYWGHQYVEQANQIVCTYIPKPVYTTNGGTANLFGLEPQYGCCTANMHQGWPKFASHLWMKTADGGLAAASYAPSVVETEIQGGKIRIELITDYPFSEDLVFKVKTSGPEKFPLYLRVPGWAKDATVKLPDGSVQKLSTGKFNKILRDWNGEETLTLHLPMDLSVRKGFQNSASVERGPLVFSLALKEQWKALRPFPYKPKGKPRYDYGVYPETYWNYALELDRKNPGQSLTYEQRPMSGNPFTIEGVSGMIRVRGKRLPSWGLDQAAAMPPPESPVISELPMEDLVLVPYGSTRLRVTEFPTLKK